VPVALLMTVLALYTPVLPALAPEGGPAAGAAAARVRPWRLGIAALLCLLCEGTMYDWSSVYMTQVWQTPLFLSVAGFGLFSAAMAAGRFGGDALRDRFGAPLLLFSGCTVAAGGALLCVWGGTRELALAGFVLVGLGLSNVIPIVFALAPAQHARAPERAIAFVSGTGFVGFLIGPPLIGLWTTLASFDTSLLLVCGAALGTAVLAGRR
jgi:MFS family permease